LRPPSFLSFPFPSLLLLPHSLPPLQNHGAVTGCIGLATNRFGAASKLGADLGTWQLGTLYLTYTASAVFGAAYVVRRLGSRNGILAGMAVYCVYVAAFLAAALVPEETKWPVAITGAAIGGVGGGFLWTAQGSYFVSSASEYAAAAGVPSPAATSYLGGIFAFFYLFTEVLMKTLSSVIVETLASTSLSSSSWILVFSTYTAASVLACFGLLLCREFPEEEEEGGGRSVCYKMTSATRLLWTDPKMKYMIPVNAAFGKESVSPFLVCVRGILCFFPRVSSWQSLDPFPVEFALLTTSFLSTPPFC